MIAEFSRALKSWLTAILLCVSALIAAEDGLKKSAMRIALKGYRFYGSAFFLTFLVMLTSGMGFSWILLSSGYVVGSLGMYSNFGSSFLFDKEIGFLLLLLLLDLGLVLPFDDMPRTEVLLDALFGLLSTATAI